MTGSTSRVSILSAIGLVSGLVALASIIIVGDTFGFPGSAAYQTYQGFNRAMAILIALEAAALIGFYVQHQETLGFIARAAVIVMLVAWIGMALGTAAEFWLFGDLPYGERNLRSTAFVVFSLSSLTVAIGLFALGVIILRRGPLHRFYGVIAMLYLPADVALFLSGQSIFLASALCAIAFAGLNLKTASGAAMLSR